MANSKERIKKAGFIPYYLDESAGMFKYLMMVSSDATYGGDKPMVSKGGQDYDEDEFGNQETILDTAIREAEEELGLVESNLNERPFYVRSKSYKHYDLYIFAGEVKDHLNFNEFHYETASTKWMTAEDFFCSGRKDHKCFIDALENRLLLAMSLNNNP